MAEKKNWIAGATANKGGLHESLGIPQGENIPQKEIAAAAKKKGKTGAQARLAQILSKFHAK